MIHPILWIDDQGNDSIMSEFRERCKRRGLELHIFTDRQLGIKEIETRSYNYEAVILDGDMYDEQERFNNVRGLSAARDAAIKRNLNAYVFTGKAYLQNNEMFNDLIGEYYIKGAGSLEHPKGTDELLDDIEEFMKSQDKHIIRERHADLLSAMKEMGFLSKGEELFMPIFEYEQDPTSHPGFNAFNHYTGLRQLMELLYRALINRGIMHPDFEKDTDSHKGINIADCTNYVAGRYANHVGYVLKSGAILSKELSDELFSILTLGNNNSHTTKMSMDDCHKVETYLQGKAGKELIVGKARSLSAIILRVYDFFLAHPNVSENAKLYTKPGIQPASDKQKNQQQVYKPNAPKPAKPVGEPKTRVTLTVKEDENGYLHASNYFICHVSKNTNAKLKPSSTVYVLGACYNTDPDTKDRYPYFLDKYNLLS